MTVDLFRRSEPPAVRLGYDERVVYEDSPGVLLRIRPHKDNDGIEDGEQMLQALHEVRTDLLGRNRSPAHSFEVWFHESRLAFHLHAASRDAAEKFKRRFRNTYPNTDIHEVAGGPTLPPIDADDYVAGAVVDTEAMPYYPIRSYEDEGFAQDPYGDILAEMVSDEDTSVVTQVVFRSAKPDWTRGSLLGRDSVDEIAEAKRQGSSVGWLNPEIRDPSEKDREAARIIEQQRGEQGFHVNLRVLVASPDRQEARMRASGVASMFGKFYNSVTEQGLRSIPVGANLFVPSRRAVRKHLKRVHERQWVDRDTIMTPAELAGLAHVPNDDVNMPAVDWSNMVAGSGVPADVPQREDVIDEGEGGSEDDEESMTRTLNDPEDPPQP